MIFLTQVDLSYSLSYASNFMKGGGEHISHFRQTVDEDSNLPTLTL